MLEPFSQISEKGQHFLNLFAVFALGMSQPVTKPSLNWVARNALPADAANHLFLR